MGLPFGDDDELIDAFAVEDALEEFFGVSEGEPGFRWRTVIVGDIEGEKSFGLREEGWEWKDYYRKIRKWVRSVLGPESPKNTAILSGRPPRRAKRRS